jgi:hypothetical protein
MQTSKTSEQLTKISRAVTNEALKLGLNAVLVDMFGPAAAAYSGILNSTFGLVFDRVWTEGSIRKLSPREQEREAKVYEAAAVQIYSRLDGGKAPRNDGFFTDIFDGRTKAEEIVEGVYIKARDQYEEKKLVHLGRFIANISFRADIPPELGNFLLRAADSLNYRQFVLLALAAQQTEFDGEPLRHRVLTQPDLIALRREEMELLDPGWFGGYGFLLGTGSWTSRITELGKDFVDMFGLNEIPQHEVAALRNLIDRCRDLPIPKPPGEIS